MRLERAIIEGRLDIIDRNLRFLEEIKILSPDQFLNSPSLLSTPLLTISRSSLLRWEPTVRAQPSSKYSVDSCPN